MKVNQGLFNETCKKVHQGVRRKLIRKANDCDFFNFPKMFEDPMKEILELTILEKAILVVKELYQIPKIIIGNNDIYID